MYEQWRDGVLEEKPAKEKVYDFDSMAPDEPQWHQNLQKAHKVRHTQKILRDAIVEKDKLQPPSLDEVRQDPNAWRKYCEEREIKRPIGRPRLRPEDRKSPKGRIKRSDLMRQLLSDHGISVNENNGLEPVSAYEGWTFLPNGRVCFEDEASISVHAFLRDYC